MRNKVSYIGKIFGRLIVKKEISMDKYSHRRFFCRCSCGNHTIKLKYNLDQNVSTSCGCFRRESITKRVRSSLLGKVFGRLTVVAIISKNKHRQIIWKCVCSCGNICKVSTSYLTSGDTKSCGCLRSACGPDSHAWRGGLATQPYCDAWADKEYKEDIKKRDNYTCQNPYCYKTDKRLSIHHIDYTKTICGPDNLITLCGACNTRANYDREWHTEWYRVIMNTKYGYKY